MLSRKNTKLMMQKNRPTKQRFGLRKLSIGVASVLLGLTWAYTGTVAADTTTSEAPATAEVVSQEAIGNDSARLTDSLSSTETALVTPQVSTSVAPSTTQPAVSAPPASDSSVVQPALPVQSNQPETNPPVLPEQPVVSGTPVQPGQSDQPVVSDVPAVQPGQLGQPDTNVPTQPEQPTTPPATKAQDGISTIDKIHTDQILKDKYGIDIEHLDAKSVLLLASLFHIFANEANLGADVNGNIAVGILGGSIDFGTRGDSIHLSNGDIYYIQNLKDAINSGSFRNPAFNHVIFGNDIDIKVIDGKVYVNGQVMNNLKPEEVFYDGDISYIDFQTVFKRLINASNFYTNQQTSNGVIIDFKDMNNQFIDVSNATATDGVIYVNIPSSILRGPQPIKIYGLSSNVNAPTVIINVIDDLGRIDIHAQIHLYYDGKDSPVNSNESHEVPNHVLWNFGSNANIVNISSGRFMGSILAPNATVNVHVNVDGNIVANIVNVIGGESHRWDIHPVFPEEIVIPPQPTDPQPTDPQPTDPQPTDPQPTDPQPTDPQPTDPQPTDPQPTDPQPTDPQPTDPQPTDPQPTDPQPTDPQPTDPQPTDPQPTDPQPTDPQPDVSTDSDHAGTTNPGTTDPGTTPQPTSPVTPTHPTTQKVSTTPGQATNQASAVPSQQSVQSISTAAAKESGAPAEAALPQLGANDHQQGKVAAAAMIALGLALQLITFGLIKRKKEQ